MSDENPPPLKYVIAETDSGIRLDRWLRRLFPHLPQSFFQRQLRLGHIRLNQTKAPANHLLSEGDHVTVAVAPGSLMTTAPVRQPGSVSRATQKMSQAVETWILHQDEGFWVLNKPPGIATQGGTNLTTSVDQAMNFWLKDRGEKAYLVHRLDKETSGLLVVARSPQAARALSHLLAQRQVAKTYMALGVGGLSPTQGVWEDWLGKQNHSPTQGRMEIRDAQATQARHAMCTYKVLETRPLSHKTPRISPEEISGSKTPPPPALLSWLELSPETGRTHQLRVQMASRGCVILGDRKYAAHDPSQRLHRTMLHLHAHHLAFAHPHTGVMLEFSAPLPEHILQTLHHYGFNAAKKDASQSRSR